MEKAKKGKHAVEPIRRGRFLLLWSLSYAASWFVLLVYTLLRRPGSTMVNVNLVGEVGILAISAVLSLLQLMLLQQQKIGWIVSSLVGTLITLVLFNAAVVTASPPMLVLSLMLLVPTSLIQFTWLFRQVKSAWLWPLANVVAALSFDFLFRGENSSQLGTGIIGIGILQGIVQAVVMHYLWTQPQTQETQTSTQIADQTDQSRAERLQEQESAPLLTETVDPSAYEESVAHQQSR